MSTIDEMLDAALRELGGIADQKALEDWRVRYLGRKGAMTEVLRGLGGLSLDERKALGAQANQAKATLESRYEEARAKLSTEAESAKVRATALDITLPGYPLPTGHKHVLMETIDEITEIFRAMGFEVALGPEAEWDYYNFEALNIPPEHPSRDDQSTFWVDSKADIGKGPMLLRTQGTAVSARVVEKMDPPIRVIEPGRVYRYEAIDATHLNAYHNVDGVAVDKGISMADLKGTLYEFSRRYFGPERRVRFRPDFFPFVEPGVEMAIECAVCHGGGCRLCGESGWLEILGAGMTHPDVLRRGGIDPDVYTSFAFGMGLERLPMLRYGIDDMRLFYTNDLRFLRQF
jgi:phenylalanyl-tRNA synthetase alpha chain